MKRTWTTKTKAGFNKDTLFKSGHLVLHLTEHYYLNCKASIWSEMVRVRPRPMKAGRSMVGYVNK